MRLNATGSNHTVSKYVLQRELGNKFPLGFQDKFRKRIYISFSNDPKHGFWDQSTSGKSGNSGQHGGVFNLEYSPDGSILIAACEQKSFIVLDPITRRDVHNVYNSHSDCVNCVKYNHDLEQKHIYMEDNSLFLIGFLIAGLLLLVLMTQQLHYGISEI